MRAAIYARHGDPGELYVGHVPEPVLGPGEALVRIRAAALNGFDPMMLQGTTKLRVPLPMTPCGDGAGEVVEFGPDTEPGEWAAGDRVLLDPVIKDKGMMGEKTPGTAAELVAVPIENMIRIPEGVTFEQAAALPVAYGTALRLVEDRAQVQAGERVLVLGATGGVGCATVQLCHRLGARVIATGSAQWKLERLASLGAEHVLSSHSGDLVTAVRALAGRPRYHVADGGGMDVIVNYIGGETWVQSLRMLRFQGRMVTCGATAGYDPPTDIRYIWSFEHTIMGSDGWTRDGLARLLGMVAAGELEPVIHKVRPLDGVREAMQELIDREVFGKSILKI